MLAVEPNGGIGWKGGLPWHVRDDMAHFARLTTATNSETKRNAVIMGRVTYESLKRPLPGRINCVVSTTISKKGVEKGVEVHCSLLDTLQWCQLQDGIETIFIAGGAALYAEAAAWADMVYLTRISESFECDTFVNLSFLDSFERIISIPAEQCTFQVYRSCHAKRHEEEQYLDLIRNLLVAGMIRNDRTGENDKMINLIK